MTKSICRHSTPCQEPRIISRISVRTPLHLSRNSLSDPELRTFSRISVRTPGVPASESHLNSAASAVQAQGIINRALSHPSFERQLPPSSIYFRHAPLRGTCLRQATSCCRQTAGGQREVILGEPERAQHSSAGPTGDNRCHLCLTAISSLCHHSHVVVCRVTQNTNYQHFKYKPMLS